MTRVLIAEDSPTQAIEFQSLLEEEDYEVMVAENGAVALDRMIERLPDVVLTDMDMPEMNGLELVNAIRLQYPTVPVILMTAQGSDALAVQALEQGAAAYIPKSNIENMLFDTLEQVLGLMRADRSYAQLIQSLEYNEFRFSLPNDPQLIDPLVDLMQQMVIGMRLCDPVGRVRIGMAIEHALLNALYRGNLEIGRDEQANVSDFTLGGETELVEQRRKEEPYCKRKLHFAARLSTEEATFVVRDEGSGFDTSALPDPGDPRMLEREGGRGLVLMRSFMDEVSFNETGNEVTMTKRCE